MKIRIAEVFVLFFSCAAAFVLGQRVAITSADDNYKVRSKYLETINAATSYSVMSILVEQITDKQYSQALCSVNLMASAEVNKVGSCLGDINCKNMVESDILKIAPELLGKGGLKIHYYKPNELCKSEKIKGG